MLRKEVYNINVVKTQKKDTQTGILIFIIQRRMEEVPLLLLF